MSAAAAAAAATSNGNSNSSVFSDFCQAWVARFPGSELPAAWEEDVRANLKRHKTKVAILREELEKEEMYVEYLDKLLADIELHRKRSSGTSGSISQQQEKRQSTVGESENTQKFLDEKLQDFHHAKAASAELTLDLTETAADGNSTFVTVINVPSPKKSTGSKKQQSLADSGSKVNKIPPRPPPKRISAGSRDSLNSVSSPTTPGSSPLLDDFATAGGDREGLDTLSPKDPLMQTKLSSSSEETLDEVGVGDEESLRRGRPDGRDNSEDKISGGGGSVPKAIKIKELMANWENKPPITARPPHLSMAPRSPIEIVKEEHSAAAAAASTATTSSSGVVMTRKDSDSGSSRGRMGSPCGKSHDSSDSAGDSPGAARRRRSGETRLDRLVRRPESSSLGARPPPKLPGVGRKPKAKPRMVMEEPLYDTVANDEEPEDEYDNHLLYGDGGTTIGSSSGSADLGFEELKSGTLSSSTDTDALSPSLRRRANSFDEEEETNYVNIQYFLQKRRDAKISTASSNTPVEEEEEGEEEEMTSSREMLDDGDNLKAEPSAAEAQRIVMYKCILNSIVDSEAIYLEGLSVMLQYMKAMKVTMSTSQPVIPKEDFEIIFYKIPDLHELHYTFLESLKKQVERWHDGDSVGHTFKMLASRTKLYAAFLDNYPRALDALHRCSEAYPQFADLTRSIKLRSVKGQRAVQQPQQTVSLEDLLHKPVARVQKHCLCLQDLLKHTPESHPDRVALGQALAQVQSFVSEYNVSHAGELFPHQERSQRHLVKNSFIVELSEGHRKLRHLFLFNDVLVCAKYKADGKRADKFTFQLKWYIPLWNALIVEEPSAEPRENSPANLVSLKTQAASLRDQIKRIHKEEEFKSGQRKASINEHRSTNSSPNTQPKASEKQRKKLAEVEAQLVLASPSLLFQVTHKQTGRSYNFFISSEYERSQWVETLQVLQSSLPTNPTVQQQKSMSMDELQSWITSCRKFLLTNMGSFLMRSPRDEPLLVGDLHLSVRHVQGLPKSSATLPENQYFVVAEVDSYGHYFRKAKTRSCSGGSSSGDPSWDEDFNIELEGSENLRLLVYEQTATSTSLRGRATLELSRSWLGALPSEQRISMGDVVLTCIVRFVTFEETMRRVPTVPTAKSSSSSSLFGAPLSTVARRERRAVPFIITSCVREVERRGLGEVGIYRVSGSAADVAKLRKAYESNPYEAEQLLKECDVHSVAGVLKQYLRDLPESVFTTQVYRQLFDAYHDSDLERRKQRYLSLFTQVPQSPNQACVVFLVEHIVRVSQCEQQNKMSLHNLATVFGPTMLHAGKSDTASKELTTGTVDVMAQAGILHFFISRRARGEPIQIVERQV